MFGLPRCDRDGLYISVPTSWQAHQLQNSLGVVNPLVRSYLSGLYCRYTELERTLVTRIAEVEFFIWSLGAFLGVALVGVVVLLYFACMITSPKGRGAFLRDPFLLIKEWVSLNILRLPDRMDVNPVMAFVSNARHCKIQ